MLYQNLKYTKTDFPELAKRVYEILDRLPLFVELTIRELLFGYSNDETLKALVEVASIFDEFGIFVSLPQYYRSDDPDFSSYKNIIFSIATTVSAGQLHLLILFFLIY